MPQSFSRYACLFSVELNSRAHGSLFPVLLGACRGDLFEVCEFVFGHNHRARLDQLPLMPQMQFWKVCEFVLRRERRARLVHLALMPQMQFWNSAKQLAITFDSSHVPCADLGSAGECRMSSELVCTVPSRHCTPRHVCTGKCTALLPFSLEVSICLHMPSLCRLAPRCACGFMAASPQTFAGPFGRTPVVLRCGRKAIQKTACARATACRCI